jgi:predicted PurR-regulated permease PerM
VTVVAVGAGLLVGGLLGAFLSVPLVAIAAQTANYYRTRNVEEPEDQALSGSTASESSS